jgi:hypothetical protein
MLIDTIQAELVRLQLHPVNLSVSGRDDPLVTLHGSLLKYWALPPCLDGQRLLAQLQGFPDAAGPEAVMNGLVAAYGNESMATNDGESTTQLRLLDLQSQSPATRQTATKKDS